MDVLVSSASVQAGLIAREDYVAESHGRRRSNPREAPSKKRRDKTSMNFNNALYHGDRATGKPGQKHTKQAE